MLEGFPLISRFTIPFADIDMMQHVNNVAYIRWCEMMRSEYFARVMGVPMNGTTGIIQANINFTYERQLLYREQIAIGVKISRVGTKSWDFYYEVWSETHGHRAAHGITTVVAFDFVKQQSITIPEHWRKAIEQYEAGAQELFV